MKTVIVNAHVISPGLDIPCASIEIADGKISKVSKAAKPGKNDWVFDAKGAYVVPGFIDVHLHGACGYDVCDATVEAIEKIAEAKLAEGCPRQRRIPQIGFQNTMLLLRARSLNLTE